MSTPEETDHKLQDLREAQQITRRASGPTPSAPSLQSVVEGAARACLRDQTGGEHLPDVVAFTEIIHRHFAPLLTERDERIGRLEKELDLARKLFAQRDAELTDTLNEVVPIEQERNALRTRCEELQRDKERLDFLESLAYGWADHEGLVPGGAMRCIDIEFDFDYFAEESFREAIDKMRNAAAEEPDEIAYYNPFQTFGKAVTATWRKLLAPRAARKEGQQAHEKGEGTL